MKVTENFNGSWRDLNFHGSYSSGNLNFHGSRSKKWKNLVGSSDHEILSFS